LLQLQGFAACGDSEVRDLVRARLARMWDTVADAAGLDPVTVKSFLAFGMLLNNVAALDVDELDEPWAKGVRTRLHAGLFEHITADTNRWNRPPPAGPSADLYAGGLAGAYFLATTAWFVIALLVWAGSNLGTLGLLLTSGLSIGLALRSLPWSRICSSLIAARQCWLCGVLAECPPPIGLHPPQEGNGSARSTTALGEGCAVHTHYRQTP
jgi:hypothetical protein